MRKPDTGPTAAETLARYALLIFAGREVEAKMLWRQWVSVDG